MKEEDIGKIFDELDKTRPIIKQVRGINNKETYYSSDRIWEVLSKFKLSQKR